MEVLQGCDEVTGAWYIICSGRQKAERDRPVGLRDVTWSEKRIRCSTGRRMRVRRGPGQGDGECERREREVVRRVQVKVRVDRTVRK